MIEVRREHYLTRLRQFLDAPAITAVTGLRRVGKSVLLRQFAASLREERQVVYVDKEALEFDHVRSARDLFDLVEARLGRPHHTFRENVVRTLRIVEHELGDAVLVDVKARSLSGIHGLMG